MIATVRGLTAGYGRTEVVHDVALDVPAGAVTCLLGRNGAGKTTLVKAMLALLPDRRGDIRLLGTPVARCKPHQISRLGVGYAPQDAGVFRELTVRENLLVARRGRSIDEGLRAALGPYPTLGDRLDQVAGTLSGGEQKMLMLARALLGAPSLVILDEICEGVQPSVVERFAAVIGAAKAGGVSFLIVEQHVAFALGVASTFAVMESGAIVERGAVDGTTAARIERHLVL